MQATPPYPEVPGDNQRHKQFFAPMLLARTGTCIGMSKTLAVWRFGAMPGSEKALAYGISTPPGHGFLWCLCTRKDGTVRETFEGAWVEIPDSFRKVVEWEPN